MVDIINELESYGVEVFVHDPQADAAEALHEYGVRLSTWQDLPRADAIVAAVAHKSYQRLASEDLCRKVVKGGGFIDVKAGFDDLALRAAGLHTWRL